MKISVVIPVYNSRNTLRTLVESIFNTLSNYDIEIILVNDACPQNSWDEIKNLSNEFDGVKGLNLSRNFGQHKAISAGLSKAVGDYVAVMDCDLQDDPKYLVNMLQCLKEEGTDLVFTVKKNREHNILKNFSAHIFNRVFNYLVTDSYIYSDNRIGNYSLLSRKVVDSYNGVNDFHRHYLLILRWLGFKRSYYEIEHRARTEGKSSYNFSKLLTHALDGITSQSDKLLFFSIKCALMIIALLMLIIIYIVYKKLTMGVVPGWSSLVIIMLFSTAINLLFIGVIGLYLGKVFEQVKGRPLFIVSEDIGDKE